MPNAVISTATSGDNTIVAAQTGYTIRVLQYVITYSGAVNVQWWSGPSASGTALTGLLYGVGTAPAPIQVTAADFGSRGHFQTGSGKALILNLSGSVGVGGHVTYELAAQ